MKLLRWIGSALVVGLLVYAARRVDWHAAAAVIGRASLIVLMCALAVNGVSLVLRGVRWWIFLRRVGATSLPLAVRGAVVGSGFNNLLIANGGDAARVLLVARASGVSRTSVLATLALERVFDPICFGLLLFSATFTVTLPSALAGARLATGTALVLAVAFLLWLARGRTRKDEPCVGHGWRRDVRVFRERVAFLSTLPGFACALACSMGVWTLQLFEYAVVARALGIQLPFAASIAAMLLINAGLVLRATPGGVGYFQFAYAAAVSHYGVTTDVAVAIALLIQIVEIVPVTIVALALAPGLVVSIRPLAGCRQPCFR